MRLTKQQYNMLHKYHLYHWVKTGICEHCQLAKRTHWANKTGKYLKHRKDDWLELCPKCHSDYDIANNLRRHYRCGYCQQRFNSINNYLAPNGTYKNGKPRTPRQLKLCDSCLKIELYAQDYFDGKRHEYSL